MRSARSVVPTSASMQTARTKVAQASQNTLKFYTLNINPPVQMPTPSGVWSSSVDVCATGMEKKGYHLVSTPVPVPICELLSTTSFPASEVNRRRLHGSLKRFLAPFGGKHG